MSDPRTKLLDELEESARQLDTILTEHPEDVPKEIFASSLAAKRGVVAAYL
jgi:hypothetical protein